MEQELQQLLDLFSRSIDSLKAIIDINTVFTLRNTFGPSFELLGRAFEKERSLRIKKEKELRYNI